jgi:hypothetical protein
MSSIPSDQARINRVHKIFLMRHQFKIDNPIVALVSIDVVYDSTLLSHVNRPIARLPHNPVEEVVLSSD